MANEFVARNGLIAQNNSTVTGSLNVTGGITGSLQGTASWAQNAVSASYAPDTTFPYTGSALITGSLRVTGSFIVNDGTNLKLDTSTHALYDQIGTQSVDWNVRLLKDQNGINSLYWDSRVLYDAIGSQSLDWASRFLYDINDVQSLAWTNRDLFDENGLQSLDWSERFLIDTSFINSVDWENRQLIDSTGNVVLDWFNLPGTLYGTASWAESASQADTASYVTTLRAGGTVGVNSVQYNNGGVLGGNSRFTFNGSSVFIGNGGTLSATGSLLGTSSYADQALSSSYALTASFALNGGGGGPAFPYTGSALVTGSIGLTGSYSNFPLVITSSTNQTIDWSQSNTFNILLTGSMTVTWSNAQNGQTLNILVTQGTAPSGNLAIWPTVNTYFPGGLIPTQSETGGKKDIYTFICIGSDIYGNYIQNY
jgi:hypothetical protein